MSDAPDPAAAARFAPGDALGPYRIVRRVGAGGMGLVFLARDEALARDVAVKVLRADAAEPGSDSARLRERFRREARAAARVAHPNVAAVYQVGHDGDVAFLATEWLAGGSMSDHLRAQVILDWR
ncbi:MAG TPA: protein kinase, partial [Humisphaera sp.]